MKDIMKLVYAIIICGLATACATIGSNSNDFDFSLQSLCSNLQNDINWGSSVAVLNFSSSSENLSNYAIEEIINNITNMHKFDVVERKKIEIIQNEINFQLSGNVSDSSIIRIGNMLGAQFVISGSIEDIGNSYKIRLFIIDVEKGVRVSSNALNIKKPDRRIAYFLNENESARNNFNGMWRGYFLTPGMDTHFEAILVIISDKVMFIVNDEDFEGGVNITGNLITENSGTFPSEEEFGAFSLVLQENRLFMHCGFINGVNVIEFKKIEE
jgi:TolB-like protein